MCAHLNQSSACKITGCRERNISHVSYSKTNYHTPFTSLCLASFAEHKKTSNGILYLPIIDKIPQHFIIKFKGCKFPAVPLKAFCHSQSDRPKEKRLFTVSTYILGSSISYYSQHIDNSSQLTEFCLKRRIVLKLGTRLPTQNQRNGGKLFPPHWQLQLLPSAPTCLLLLISTSLRQLLVVSLGQAQQLNLVLRTSGIISSR